MHLRETETDKPQVTLLAAVRHLKAPTLLQAGHAPASGRH